MKNREFIAVFFLPIVFPFLSLGADGRLEQKRFAPYSVSLSQRYADGMGKILIHRDDNEVFSESEVDNHYTFGNDFDENISKKDIYSGRDITGNGKPNLVISNWTGGAHCCHFLLIFEMGEKLKKLTTVEALSSSIRLVDLDNDGIPEIEFFDGSIDYLFASFADSPKGRVVLKFQKDHYELASSLMKSSAPTFQHLRKMKKKIRAAFMKNESPYLPYVFLKTMMDLSYSGHFLLAMGMAGDVWPKHRPGLIEFRREFEEALRSSQYWKEF